MLVITDIIMSKAGGISCLFVLFQLLWSLWGRLPRDVLACGSTIVRNLFRQPV